MNAKLNVFAATLSLLVGTVLVSSPSRAAAVSARPHPSDGQPQSYLVLTRNGIPYGQPMTAPCTGTSSDSCANDLHYLWSVAGGRCYAGYQIPTVWLVFTTDGAVVGKPKKAPCKDDGFTLMWTPGTPSTVTSAAWTTDGKKENIDDEHRIAVPKGANDTHLYWAATAGRDVGTHRGHVTSAYWSHDGTNIGNISVIPSDYPPNEPIDDLHWYGYAPAGGLTSSVTTAVGSKSSGPTVSPCDSTSQLCANDLHVSWNSAKGCVLGIQIPPVQLVWTVNGSPAPSSPPVLAPCDANGFDFGWTANNTVGWAFWSRDGQPLQAPMSVFPLPSPPGPWLTPPAGANDVHLWFGGARVDPTTAWWTLNGSPFSPRIHIPAHTNSLSWSTGSGC